MNGSYLFIAIAVLFATNANGSEFGEKVGNIQTFAHEVVGEVFAVDNSRLLIRGFTYDGTGPDAYFYVGTSGTMASRDGIKIRAPGTSTDGPVPILRRYSNEDVILTLPANLKVENIKWFSIWCVQFSVDFGSLTFPENLAIPAARSIGAFQGKTHGVRSGEVTILDSKRIKIENLHYDGAGPDAYFLVGNGNVHHRSATKVPNEEGSTGVLKGYTGQTVELELPGDLTFSDIEWLSMYCIRFNENFGEVSIPSNLNVPPHLSDNMNQNTRKTSEARPTSDKKSKAEAKQEQRLTNLRSASPTTPSSSTTTTPRSTILTQTRQPARATSRGPQVTTTEKPKKTNTKANTRKSSQSTADLRNLWLQRICKRFNYAFRACESVKP